MLSEIRYVIRKTMYKTLIIKWSIPCVRSEGHFNRLFFFNVTKITLFPWHCISILPHLNCLVEPARFRKYIFQKVPRIYSRSYHFTLYSFYSFFFLYAVQTHWEYLTKESLGKWSFRWSKLFIDIETERLKSLANLYDISMIML